MVTRTAVVVACALAGCFDPRPQPGGPCAPFERCPQGLFCEQGVCVAAPAADANGGDSALDTSTPDSPDVPVAGPSWQDVKLGSVHNTIIGSVTAANNVAAPDALYVAVISVKPSRAVSSVSGLGLTWRLVREQCAGRDTARLAMFWATGPSPTAGAVTASLGGLPFVGSAVIAVHRYSDADPVAPIGNVVTANTNGLDAAALCANGTDTAMYSFSALDTGAPSSVVITGVHTARYMHDPGAGYVERSDLQSADDAAGAGVAVEERTIANPSTDVAVVGGFGGSAPDWVVIAAEIRD